MGVALRPSQPLSAAPPSLLTRLPAPARALPRAAVLQGQPAPAWALHGRSSCRKDPPAAAWGPPRAAGWLSAPAGSLQGCRGSLLRACSTSCPPPPPPPPPPPSGSLCCCSLLAFLLLCLCRLWPLLKPGFPQAPPVWLRGWAVSCGGAAGAGWDWLEPAVSGMGQPRPLLREAALQPLLLVPGHGHPIYHKSL